MPLDLTNVTSSDGFTFADIVEFDKVSNPGFVAVRIKDVDTIFGITNARWDASSREPHIKLYRSTRKGFTDNLYPEDSTNEAKAFAGKMGKGEN